IADGDPVAVVTNFEGDPSLGDVDALDGAGGEALEAPHPGVARLAPMLALGGEVRGEYFSEDTPVGTVQDTLEDGGFTGYVELSENVLSGDYYVVFVEGRAEYVAVVGSTERLYTGADAEEKTRNEVGIYSVVAVDLPAVALPEPSGDERGVGGVAAGAGTDAASADDAAVGEDPATDPGTEEPTVVGDDPGTGTDTNGPTDVGDDERDVGGGSGTAT
ncbi:transcriptional regulator, partial [Halobacteriales archaeon SW_12_69_24]